MINLARQIAPTKNAAKSSKVLRANLRRRQPDPSASFLQYVDRSGGRSACHPWTGEASGGFGWFRPAPGFLVSAHRFALELKLGRRLSNAEVPQHAATCAARSCCNPAHLRAVLIAGASDTELVSGLDEAAAWLRARIATRQRDAAERRRAANAKHRRPRAARASEGCR